MAIVTICSDFEAPKNKVCHCFYCFPTYFPWSDGTGCHHLRFWVLSVKPSFSLSSFTFIKRLFSSLLSAISVVSSVYLRLTFLPAVLIPPCASSSPKFCRMYSAYKLNTQDDNIQLWCTYFPNLEPVCCSMSSFNCCFLTCIQISQEAGQGKTLCFLQMRLNLFKSLDSESVSAEEGLPCSLPLISSEYEGPD